jgi:benzoyl-CoA reductase/2-hydroxyglutaryl-CoA dehydratase subunit BcrC/BadD/HgdB
MHVLALPHRQDEAALEYQLRLLGRFKAALEELAGGEITPDALRHSIQVYNQGRAKLRKLYQLRRQKPGLLGAREVLDVVVAAMLMPKEEHNRWLDELLVEVEAAPTPPPAPGQVKLFLAGQPCDPPDADLLDIIEAEGAVVVDDDMYTGFRYFATEVAPDGDPLMALARHYLNLIPCATTHRRELFLRPGREGPEDYGQFIIRMAKESGADGVVIMLVLYCDPYGFECVPLDDKLTKVGIPHLLVETEPETGALGRLRTRLQAFIEMVREQKLA